MNLREWSALHAVNLRWVAGYLIGALLSFSLVTPDTIEEFDAKVEARQLVSELETVKEVTQGVLDNLDKLMAAEKAGTPEKADALLKDYLDAANQPFFAEGYLEKTGIGSYQNRDEILSLRDSLLELGKSIQLNTRGYLRDEDREELNDTDIEALKTNIRDRMDYIERMITENLDFLDHITMKMKISRFYSKIEIPLMLSVFALVCFLVMLIFIGKPKKKGKGDG